MTRTNDIHYLHDINNDVELIFCENSTISYPLHNHVSVFTIGMILDGSILLSNQCCSQIYTKDQVFTILPYMPHRIEPNSKYTLLSLCIHKNLLSYYDCDIDKLNVAIVNLLNNTIVSHKINQIKIIKLLSCIHSFYEDRLAFDHQAKFPHIDNLKQQIESFPEVKFSIEEMAQAAFISKYHFIRSFKQVVGLTPHQFQLQNRIRKAQRLISNAATITEVALTTGFCDQSHFIKQFERYIGLTPTTYKRSSRVFNSDSMG